MELAGGLACGVAGWLVSLAGQQGGRCVSLGEGFLHDFVAICV